MVIGNRRLQMVDVVEPDVAGEPLQDPGQLVERTALERRPGEIPLLAPRPIDAIELMLHIEQPDPGGTGHRRDDHLNQEVGFKTEHPTQRDGHSQNGQIRPVHRVTLPFPGVARGEPVEKQEQAGRRDHKQHDRVARQPVRKPFPAGRLEILPHRQRPHVAHAAPIQVSRMAMVKGVLPSPLMERREHQDTGDESQDGRRPPGFEKRAVAAVMENDERAHQESARHHHQRHGQPAGHRQTPVNQIPENRIGNEGVDYLPDTVRNTRHPEGGRDLPAGRNGRDLLPSGRPCICSHHHVFSFSGNPPGSAR